MHYIYGRIIQNVCNVVFFPNKCMVPLITRVIFKGIVLFSYIMSILHSVDTGTQKDCVFFLYL
jgi:hypothetical protein